MNARLLLPLAIVQGLWLLQRTPTLPAPAGDSGQLGRGRGRPLVVVGIGDSIMVGTGVREQRHSLTATYARLLHEHLSRDVAWRAHGRNGATSEAILCGVAPAARAADVYLLSCGVNDATRGVGVQQFAANFRAILALLRKKAPNATVLYGGLPPLDRFPALPWPLSAILAERVDAMRAAAAAALAEDGHSHCFQFPQAMPAEHFASDGFHPAERACERWARGLLELWPSSRSPPGATA